MLKSVCNVLIFARPNQSVHLKHKNTMHFWALTRIGDFTGKCI